MGRSGETTSTGSGGAMRRAGQGLALAALACLLAACTRSAFTADGTPGSAVQLPLPAAAAAELPAPDAARLPASAYTENQLWGGSWANYMPSNLVSDQFGWAAFAPQAAEQPAGLAGLAYATYVFSIKHPTSPRLRLDLSWDGTPPAGNSYYIALANWQQHRWEWHSVYAPFKFGLPSSQAYLYPGLGNTEYLAVVVAVRGNLPATLGYVTLGAYSNTLPYPAVTWTCGDPANEIVLDASHSSDPDGSIEHYLWDFDADGVFDAQGPRAVHSFAPSVSALPVLLRVYDDDQQYAELTTDVLPINWNHEPLSLQTGNLARAELDGLDRLHFSYLALDGATVMYALYAGGQWLIEPVYFHPAALECSQIELALAPDGEPQLAYIARAAGAPAEAAAQVYYARRSAGAWQHELVDEPLSGTIGPVALGLKLDSAGEPQLAYGGASAPGQPALILASHGAGGWSAAPAVDLPWPALNVALALDSQDYPLLAVSGYPPPEAWSYAQAVLYRFDGSGWESLTTLQTLNLLVQSVAVTPEDGPLILTSLGGPVAGTSLMYMVPLGGELSLYSAGTVLERSLLTRGPSGALASLTASAYAGSGMTFTELDTSAQIPLRNYILCDKRTGAAAGAGYDAAGRAWAVYRSAGRYILARRLP